MVLHIPHACLDVAGKKFMCDIEDELLHMTDHYTDELFDLPGVVKVVAPISRLVCDMERFEDDTIEVMASKGMGVCYTHGSSGKMIRHFSLEDKENILETYYRPHHKALEKAVEDELKKVGHALIIDCHSFSNKPLSHETDQNQHRPDICIGTDLYHSPPALIEKIVIAFMNEGYSVELNTPFSGTIVPSRYYHSNKKVYSIMIEINRQLYMDEFGNRNHQFEKVLISIQNVLSEL